VWRAACRRAGRVPCRADLSPPQMARRRAPRPHRRRRYLRHTRGMFIVFECGGCEQTCCSHCCCSRDQTQTALTVQRCWGCRRMFRVSIAKTPASSSPPRWQTAADVSNCSPTTVPRAARGGEPVPRRQATRSPSSKDPPASAAATCGPWFVKLGQSTNPLWPTSTTLPQLPTTPAGRRTQWEHSCHLWHRQWQCGS
jgi:hypothetical protein